MTEFFSVFPNFNSLTDLDTFNDHFIEVGPNLQKTIPPEPTIPTNMNQVQSMFLKPITEIEVEKSRELQNKGLNWH